MVFQAPLLFDVDVLANAASGLRFHGVGRRAAEDRAHDWLNRFGVIHLARRSPRTLSAGEAQRVSLARAFAIEPDLLLLDEPFAALDSPTRAALVPELARHLRETGTAAIIVTHDQEEALALGDHLGVMLAGRIVQFGSPSNVVARPASAAVAVFLGIANVFAGRVDLVKSDRAIVQLSDGGPRIAVCVSLTGPMAVGQLVDVALPAEMVSVLTEGAAAPAGWNALAGTVVQTAPTPGGLRVTVDCGVLIRAAIPRIAGPLDMTIGLSVRVAFSPESAHLMPRDNHLGG
jgi:tungstate transport system ATP-binding protein